MFTRRTLWKGLLSVGLLLAAFAGLAAWRLSVSTEVPVQPGDASLYDLTALDLDGHTVPLSAWRGQVALVVNVASECALAVQYPRLDAVYHRYKDRGFVVLAFPSNDFWQEPNADADIRKVCDARGVTFPVFARSHVRGARRSEIFTFLAVTGHIPLWNFAKYLVGRDGQPRAFFGSLVEPDNPTLASAIERALAESIPIAGRD